MSWSKRMGLVLTGLLVGALGAAMFGPIGVGAQEGDDDAKKPGCGRPGRERPAIQDDDTRAERRQELAELRAEFKDFMEENGTDATGSDLREQFRAFAAEKGIDLPADGPRRGMRGPRGPHHGPGGPAIHNESIVRDGDDGFMTITMDRGTVTAVSGSTITIERADGVSVSATAGDDTVVCRSGEEASLGDIKAGDMAGLVQVTKDGDTTLRSVHAGEPKASDEQATASPAVLGGLAA